jgi:HPt (histidine-containing phosphotransfer) domain-containing protein
MALPAFTAENGSVPQARVMRPIDLVHLAKQCLGDENLEYEILRMFEKSLTTYFERLKLATSADDLHLNIHSIRGASAGVGAWTVAELAKAMENELREGRPLTSERIDDLGIAIEEVRDFIARMLTSQQD